MILFINNISVFFRYLRFFFRLNQIGWRCSIAAVVVVFALCFFFTVSSDKIFKIVLAMLNILEIWMNLCVVNGIFGQTPLNTIHIVSIDSTKFPVQIDNKHSPMAQKTRKKRAKKKPIKFREIYTNRRSPTVYTDRLTNKQSLWLARMTIRKYIRPRTVRYRVAFFWWRIFLMITSITFHTYIIGFSYFCTKPIFLGHWFSAT